MSTSPARAAAFDVLLRIEQQDAYASELLHSSQYERLSPADHGLATELVMGVLRWRSLLDVEISRFSDKRVEKLDIEVLTALRLAAYQLLFLDRIPGRAAVHESVELVKRARKGSAAPFANAVLRKLAGRASAAKAASEEGGANAALKRRSIQDPVEEQKGDTGKSESAVELSRNLAHPLWLIERWVRQFGLDRTRRICGSDQHAPAAAVRLADAGTETELRLDGIDLAPGQLLASARRVRAGNVSSTRAFAEGRVAIQDEASQLVALLVGAGSRILDCCAAPGGKTRVLAQRNPGARIVALELHAHRARLLRKLVPLSNVEVINSDVLEFKASAAFDRVLADVPCSGTGTLAHNPEIKWRLKPEDLADLHGRQLAIVRAAMRQVAPRGRLVYSTCSLEPEENEQVVDEALSTDAAFRVLDCRLALERLRTEGELVWNELESLVTGPFLRTIPGVHPSDGFFVAILEKS
jgi:16S rRNA (cytosine967-C5)-methyltransferase